MKKQSENTIAPLNQKEVETLTLVVKETLAVHINRQRIFSAADLWAIQRRGRTMLQRRQFAY